MVGVGFDCCDIADQGIIQVTPSDPQDGEIMPWPTESPLQGWLL